jgi:hypothetical protein
MLGWAMLSRQEMGLVERSLANGEQDTHPEWNEIREIKSGTVERKVTEDRPPGGPRERTITYEASFDRCNREQDYATVWKEFERTTTS